MDQQAAQGDALDEMAPEHRLTPKERSLLVLSELVPASGYSNVPVAIAVNTELRWWPLQEAFTIVLRRHSAMRTVFTSSTAGFIKNVVPRGDFDVRVEIHSATPEALDDALTEFAATPFALNGGPLVRLGVFRTPDHDTVCLVAHHLVFDGTSIYVVLDELIELYDLLADDRPVPPALTAQAPTRADREPTEAGLRYWRAHLNGADPTRARIACGREEPTEPRLTGGFARYPVPDAVRAAVDRLRRRHRVTENIVHLAAYALLLSMYGAGDDLVIGLPLDVRGSGERSVVGFHANIIAIRLAISSEGGFAGHVSRVRDTFLAGLEHADTTVDAVLDAVRPEVTAWRTNPFRYLFNYLPKRISSTGISLGGAQARTVPVYNGHSRFDLEFLVLVGADGVWVEATYSDEIHDRSEVDTLVERYFALLEDIDRRPDSGLAEFRMATARDRAVLTPTAESTPATTVAQLIGEHVRSHPDLPALSTPDGVMTYAALWSWAHSIARALHDYGLRPGEVVGLAIPDPRTRVAAMLGGWLAGAVLADAGGLRGRGRRHIAADRMRLLLVPAEQTGGTHAGTLSVPSQPAVDQAAPEPARTSNEDAPALRTCGVKPVMLPHSALAASAAWLADQLTDTPTGTAAVPDSPRLDRFATDVLPHLVRGACVVFGDSKGDTATVRHLGPQGTRLLATDPVAVSGRVLVCEGAEIPTRSVDALRSAGGRVIRAHRDPETALWLACGEVNQRGCPPGWVGSPPTAIRARIADRRGRDLLPGLDGTVYFDIPGTEVVTGGWPGRLGWDGAVEFAGRPVNLAVAEQELEELPGVVVAAVAAKADCAPVALVQTNGRVELPEIQAHVGKKSMMVSIGTVPVNAFDEVDYDRVVMTSTPAGTPVDSEDTRVLDALVSLWAESLPEVAVDADTDFFKAGGKSLSAARLAHKASRLVQRRVKLEALFSAPTPRLLAVALRTH